MKNFLSILIKIFLFWIFFFFIQRITFLAYQLHNLSHADLSTILLSNWYSLRYDVSAASYILIIPFLLIITEAVSTIKTTKKIMFIYQTVMICFSSLINIVDMGLYDAWGTKLNNRALSYLQYPKEVFASTASSPIVLLLILLFIQIIAGMIVFKKYFQSTPKLKLPLYQTIVLSILFIAALMIGMRGGTQKMPITKGWAYFSKHSVVNHASINAPWNLLYDLSHLKDESKPYNYFPDVIAKKIVDTIYKHNDAATTKILTTERPNIVIIMLESWGADIIGGLGGEKNVTPCFNKLAEQGLLFTNFYSNGFRTEQGLAAIISSFPAQPKTSVLRDFGKFEKLPGIVHFLDSNNYYSAAYYGANLDFANTGSYFHTAGFKKIIGEHDFSFKGRTLWGAYDEDLFNFQVNDLKSLPQPFFSLMLSITSHEPFDAPGDPVFKGDDMSQKYRNAVHYTDKCLGEYFEKAKKESWYPNTLFIIVADHAHIYPLGRTYNEPLRYRIPLLFYGDVIQKEQWGKTVDKYGSHTDISATILAQLNIKNDLRWSKDLLNTFSPSFSFYTFDDGFGWLTDKATFVFDNSAQKIMIQNSMLDEKQNAELINNGKAYLQMIQEEYLSY